MYTFLVVLAAISIAVLYLLIKNMIKRTVKKEMKEIKEPLEVLANYIVQLSQEPQVEETDKAVVVAETGGQTQAQDPVDIMEEFEELKNTNKMSTYNLKVQKLWELYQQKKISEKQYNKQLSELKKEYNIPEEQPPAK